MRIHSVHNARGFTLLEVLIALAVLAIGMIAVIGTAGTSTRTAAELKEETFAHWVAMNELASLRLSANWPSLGTLKGHADMAGVQWNWKADIKSTSDPDLIRVDIDVSNSASPDEVISSLTGFIGQSHQLPPPGSPGSQSPPSGSTPLIP